MIWRATATMQAGSLTLDQTLTFDAASFGDAVEKTYRTFQPAATVITGVALAVCAATRWDGFGDDGDKCDLPATRTDGVCDECRERMTEAEIAELER
jgi:hypothetical protein